MSLLSSIFGAGKPGGSGASSVFESKIDVPVVPPLPRPVDVESTAKSTRKKRKVREDDKETDAEVVEKPKEEDDRVIFVGNLPISCDRKMLAKLFQDCGKIKSTRIRSVAVTGIKLPPEHAGKQNLVKKVCANTKLIDSSAKSSVVGYVVFADPASVAEALKLNNKEIEKGRRIRVDNASAEYDARRSVFVGNLPYGAEESSLQEHFSRGCGLEITDIEGVRIVRDKETAQCKGFGYVLFRERSMVAIALQRMVGSSYLRRELRVQVCGKRFAGKKARHSPRNIATPADTEGKPDAHAHPSVINSEKSSAGVLRRLLEKSSKATPEKKKRARGDKSKRKPTRKPGVSKRAALDAKVEKRVKKLEKRASKGMGKNKR